MNSISSIENSKKELVKDVYTLAYLGEQLVDSNKGSVLIHNGSKSSLMIDMKAKYIMNPV